jgi:CHAT domain-containing protein
MRGLVFDRLPGTRAEVETIHALLGPDQGALYTDKDAREAILMQCDAPRMVHLATHGFFLEDQELPDVGGDGLSRALTFGSLPLSSPSPTASPAPSGSKRFENPLLRSGIVLAGANTAIGADGHARGIVTAEKILGLNLRGTEMVVLSACETGLGDVQAGEGVFGLRRAFTQAGAKSLVMSLWSVPDQETQELMVQFYRYLLTDSMSRSQALRQAALQQIRIVEERYGFPHPLYWGAFVFMGEP